MLKHQRGTDAPELDRLASLFQERAQTHQCEIRQLAIELEQQIAPEIWEHRNSSGTNA
jgi:hypothetical protein